MYITSSRRRRTALSGFCPDSLSGFCRSKSRNFSREGFRMSGFRIWTCFWPILTDRHRTVDPDRILTVLSADVCSVIHKDFMIKLNYQFSPERAFFLDDVFCWILFNIKKCESWIICFTIIDLFALLICIILNHLFHKRPNSDSLGQTKVKNKQMEEELKCPACFNLFTPPVRITTCGHNYWWNSNFIFIDPWKIDFCLIFFKMAYVTKEMRWKGVWYWVRIFNFETAFPRKSFWKQLTCYMYIWKRPSRKNDLLRPNMAFRGFASKLLRILKNKVWIPRLPTMLDNVYGNTLDLPS